MRVSYQPELLYVDGCFRNDYELVVGDDGKIVSVGSVAAKKNLEGVFDVRWLPGRALLPGMIDIHSHSFQRALRGKAESTLHGWRFSR
jgi:formimidoylglutamate deiminase